MAVVKLILNEELVPDLREALDRDAEAEDITTNDAAVRILAQEFGTEWKPSGFPFRELASRFKLRVPDELHWKIRMEAANTSATIRGVVLNVLAKHYKTSATSPYRRLRKEAV